MNKLLLLFLLVFTSLESQAQTGSTCSTAIALTANGQCQNNLQTSTVNTWYVFTASNSAIEIDVASTSLYTANGFTQV